MGFLSGKEKKIYLIAISTLTGFLLFGLVFEGKYTKNKRRKKQRSGRKEPNIGTVFTLFSDIALVEGEKEGNTKNENLELLEKQKKKVCSVTKVCGKTFF